MVKSTGSTVAIFSNTFWSLYNFRKSLIQALLSRGYRVVAISADDPYRSRLEELGCETVTIKNLDAESVSVRKELRLISEIRKALRNHPCDYLFTYTIKPNLYSALTSLFNHTRIITTINGLGNSLSGSGVVRSIILQLYRLAFRRAYRVVFQNKDDYSFFRSQMKMNEKKVAFVRGSGVNVQEFTLSKKAPAAGDQLIFLLACRLLKEKGVYEYIETAERIKATHPQAQFWLLGMKAKNPSAIALAELQPDHDRGVIRSIPPTDNIGALLEKVDVLVLPSYYNEGIPRILLEGLSKGLPLITTNSVGCRETVADGRNGYLIEPRQVDSLEAAVRRMMALSPERRTAMGNASRRMAETEFDERKVIETYLGMLQHDHPQVVLRQAYSE